MALSVGKIVQRTLLLVTGALFLGATAVYFIGSANAPQSGPDLVAAPAVEDTPAPEIVIAEMPEPAAETATETVAPDLAVASAENPAAAETEADAEGSGWLTKVSGFFQSDDATAETEFDEIELTEVTLDEVAPEDSGPRVVIRGGSQPTASGTCRIEGGVRRCSIMSELSAEE